MKLSELHIDQVRNIEHAQLDSLADINIIYGENGAGKTTL
ncbi:MAG: AAA family ATPase, partial [Pseudomonadales bacterium]|nr:AAA family ATPase [Pseudomonadales bacterium]